MEPAVLSALISKSKVVSKNQFDSKNHTCHGTTLMPVSEIPARLLLTPQSVAVSLPLADIN